MTIHLTFDDPTPPPCVGQGNLFSSTLLADHHVAAAHCNKGRTYNRNAPECPFLLACKQRLNDTLADGLPGHVVAEGTWAGELVGVPGKPGRKRNAA